MKKYLIAIWTIIVIVAGFLAVPYALEPSIHEGQEIRLQIQANNILKVDTDQAITFEAEDCSNFEVTNGEVDFEAVTYPAPLTSKCDGLVYNLSIELVGSQKLWLEVGDTVYTKVTADDPVRVILVDTDPTEVYASMVTLGLIAWIVGLLSIAML